MERFLRIDRRIIFASITVAVIVSLILQFELPIPASEPVQEIYEEIESLPKGSRVMIAFDYDPASKEELQPMAVAFLHHCFSRDLKVIGMTHYPGAPGLAEQAMTSVANQYQKKYGEDYVFLGYKPGSASLIINMGENLYSAFPKDFYGNDTTTLPALQDVDSLREINFLFDLAAGTTIETWIAFGKEKYKFDMGAGCTAVMGPDMYPFLQSKQLTGLLGGLKGAAEYEALIRKKANAVSGMRPQSVVHVIIIIFVIFGNIVYFTTRRTRHA
ncbi:MAG: hypothetical protein HRU72_11395 [Planctomycetia bacterium]|uniref:Uncharacterized protein n=1 Tax=Candidatus Brocadia sapporoensis TaxID=392547 RepID=A0A1V6LYY0_9BACT|nr:hypothetical protein [Candidatus Brocadia sapporoensis]MCC7239408.1 hypothetical protein [Candidatus Brocadia sp.]QOJ07100.1 MAG: hypothetical protein HRU72_11395 [Planctomycetia bacterium]TVL97848.1 MAG: hypothetical protein CV082_02530 [Candidatus Brocadia sp. BL1]MDG6006177.1 hypothetical protein [Candidatus Brocadia sp.]OQD45343.1 hypothetical protein BIY37_09070 [Candidatus Brocadia sapporoensis]